jgi:hypothetical protein
MTEIAGGQELASGLALARRINNLGILQLVTIVIRLISVGTFVMYSVARLTA